MKVNLWNGTNKIDTVELTKSEPNDIVAIIDQNGNIYVPKHMSNVEMILRQRGDVMEVNIRGQPQMSVSDD